LKVSYLKLPNEKANSIWNIIDVAKMSRSNDERALANQVTHCTNYLRLISGEVRNTSAILFVARVAKENNTFDLVLNSTRELRDGSVHDSRPLTVSTRNDLGVRALGRRKFKEPLGFVDSNLVRSLRQKVRGQVGDIRRRNTLACDLAGLPEFQGIAGGWPDGAALDLIVSVTSC
jgi:hypothetical protein